MSTKTQAAPWWIDFAAGSISGTCALFVGHPFETVKAVCQTTSKKQNVMGVCKNIWKRSGIKGFYRGLSMPLFGYSFYMAALITANGRMKKIVHPDESTPLGLDELVLSGIMTAPFAAAVVAPMEYFKVNLQVAKSIKRATTYKGPIDLFVKTIRNKSVFTFWNSFPLLVPMRMLGLSFYFTSYELTKRALSREDGTTGYGSMIIAGGVSGLSFWLPTIPFDTVKARVITSSNKNPFFHAKKIMQQGGLRAFYRGAIPCLLRAAPNSMLLLPLQDVFRNLFLYATKQEMSSPLVKENIK